MRFCDELYFKLLEGEGIDNSLKMLDMVLEEARIKSPKKAINQLVKDDRGEELFNINLDYELNDYRQKVELFSFYAGIDYAMYLLGQESVFDLLPLENLSRDMNNLFDFSYLI